MLFSQGYITDDAVAMSSISVLQLNEATYWWRALPVLAKQKLQK